MRTTWPRRVLVTNDNGIKDPGLVELARALGRVAETHVAAPRRDTSDSAHVFVSEVAGELRVVPCALPAVSSSWVVDGYPADCVLFALGGPLSDTPPDLLVAGINDHPNLGSGWLNSGTIGAARAAAFLGIPALAISGLDHALEGALDAAVRWTVELTQCPWLRELGPNTYVTVSLPAMPPGEIRGVRVAQRAGLTASFRFSKTRRRRGGQEIWRFEPEPRPEMVNPDSDVALHAEGYIVLVPMRADEHDHELLQRWRRNVPTVPAWPVGG